jgi:transglutaminase-like putative cysteine protease
MTAALRVAIAISALLLPGAAHAARLPAWLTVADTRKAPVQALEEISEARLAAVEAEKHPWLERLRRIEHDLRGDGSAETRIVIARQLLNDEGVRRGGTLSVSVRTETERLFIDEAYVVSPSGRRQPFDIKTLQITADGTTDLFHDGYVVALPFAKLEVRSTVVVAVRVVRDNRRWPLPWSSIHQTQTGVPGERLEIGVRWAAGRPAPNWKTDDPKLECREEERRVACSKRTIAAIPIDPEVANWDDVLPSFVVSDATSWAALVQIERKLLDPGDDSPDVAATADALLKGALSPAERMARLLRYVANDIRYVGFEHGRGAVTPRRPGVTLARRFGDCKDKVALLLAMARRAGLDAQPVLVASDHRDPKKLLLPSWKYFDHVIACVRTDPASAELTCMDPTVPDLVPGTLPFGVRTAVTLPLATATEPRNLPNPDGPGWQIDVETLNQVACDGSIKEVVVRRYRGSGASVMRARLRPQNQEERLRWLEEAFAAVMGEKVKPKVSYEGLDAPMSPLELRSIATYPGTRPVRDVSEWTDGDPWLTWIARDFRTDNRHHPYALSGAIVRSDAIFEFCPEVSPRFRGAEIGLDSEFGQLTRSYTIEGQRAIVKTVLTLPPQTVAAANLVRFNRFIDAALAQTRIWLGFSKLGIRRP